MPYKDPEDHKRWKQANRDKVSEQNRRYYEAHREEVRENQERRVRIGSGMYLGISGMTRKQRQKFLEDLENGKTK